MDQLNVTLPGLFNICDRIKADMAQIEQFKDPFFREPNTRIFITTIYTTVACIGAIGNLFVVAAVVRNPQMRTPRNYFIINLALSDLLMCTLTVPFTLYYILNTFWALGTITCRIVASVQGVNIFVSTMSITAIGLDRYWVILFPTKTKQQRVVIVLCFTFIWIFSFLLASPLFYATDTKSLPQLERLAKCGIVLLVCTEDFDQMPFDKRVYTISSEAFQYVLPLTMLTFVYTRIIWRLENRMVYRQRAVVSQFENSTMVGGGASANCAQATNRAQNRRRSLEVRQRRMNLLLICVVTFFAFCWLPLNVYNALISFEVLLYNVVWFSSCHVFGMMSACANPIFYGVFNENFRQEFIAILTWLRIMPLIRYLRKAAGRTDTWDSDTHGTNAGGIYAQQTSNALRSSFKRSRASQNGRRNSNRVNHRAVDNSHKFLDVPSARPSASVSTANGYCNISSATGTHCYSSSPPTIHVDDFEIPPLSNGAIKDCASASPKNKLDQLIVGDSTPEENTPLFSESSTSVMSDQDSRLNSYVLTTVI